MRRSLILPAAAALFLTARVPGTQAQSHEVSQLSSCIKEFYDPGMYNYLTYQNNCAQALTVVFVAKDGSGAMGKLDLRPGARDSVGRSADGKVPKVGAFDLYVCNVGYMPVDENNQPITKPKTAFHCQAKAQ